MTDDAPTPPFLEQVERAHQTALAFGMGPILPEEVIIMQRKGVWYLRDSDDGSSIPAVVRHAAISWWLQRFCHRHKTTRLPAHLDYNEHGPTPATAEFYLGWAQSVIQATRESQK